MHVGEAIAVMWTVRAWKHMWADAIDAHEKEAEEHSYTRLVLGRRREEVAQLRETFGANHTTDRGTVVEAIYVEQPSGRVRRTLMGPNTSGDSSIAIRHGVAYITQAGRHRGYRYAHERWSEVPT